VFSVKPSIFDQELSALLDVIAYIEDKELREELEGAVVSTARSIESARMRKSREEVANNAGLCRFNEAWRGRCNKPSVNEARTLCEDHLGVMCRGKDCHRHAVMTCSQTMGAFVCGMPVCKKHEYDDGRGRHL
jgi:hypothetical protein